MLRDGFPIPAAQHRAEVVFDRSRFLCTLDHTATPQDADALLRDLRAEMPDATHHCWAYVAGPPGDTSRIGMSDAGEPHGTAGRPMLTVLLHSGVGEIGAIVTRYYGGTNLGTGGLVKAYSAAVQAALAEMPRQMKVDYVVMELTVGHAFVTPLRLLLAAQRVEVTSESYGTDVRYGLNIPRDAMATVQRAVADLTRGMGAWREGG